MEARRSALLASLKSACLVRGNEFPIFPKGTNPVPKRGAEDWLLDFRRAFLDAGTARDVAKEFWDAYESRFPFRIAVVEMGSVPLVGSLLAEGLARGKRTDAVILRKSRKKDGLCNVVEGRPGNGETPVILVDDIVNSGNSLAKALGTAKNENLPVREVFCVCHFRNPNFAETMERAGFSGMPVRALFGLADFWLERFRPKPGSGTYAAESRLLADLGEPHLGLVVPKSSLLLSDGCLYAAGESGKLVKIDPSDGSVLWEYRMRKTDKGKNVLSGIEDCGSEVCFWGYDGAVHFVDKATGSGRAYSLADWIGSTPFPDLPSGRAFVGLEHFGSRAGGVAAFQISDGEILWESPDVGFTHASPAYCPDSDTVFCGSNSGTFRCLRAGDGSVLWQRDFGHPIKIRPTVSPDGSKVFFGCFDGMLRCLDARDGRTLWEFRTPFNAYSEALGGEDGVFVWCSDKNFYHFDWNGALLATVPTEWRIFAPPTRFRERLVAFGSNDGDLRFYDPASRRCVLRVRHGERIVTAVRFRGDEAFLEDFLDRVWKLDLSKLIPST